MLLLSSLVTSYFLSLSSTFRSSLTGFVLCLSFLIECKLDVSKSLVMFRLFVVLHLLHFLFLPKRPTHYLVDLCTCARTWRSRVNSTKAAKIIRILCQIPPSLRLTHVRKIINPLPLELLPPPHGGSPSFTRMRV